MPRVESTFNNNLIRKPMGFTKYNTTILIFIVRM